MKKLLLVFVSILFVSSCGASDTHERLQDQINNLEKAGAESLTNKNIEAIKKDSQSGSFIYGTEI